MLLNDYWRIRVEGQDKVNHFRYYRYFAKEKLRLAESGVDQVLIIAVCRYLVNFNVVGGRKVNELMMIESKQFAFDSRSYFY